MTTQFPSGPEDPVYVQLAAQLMDAIATRFSAWLVDMMLKDHAPVDITNAACMVFSAQISLLMQHCGAPGREADFAHAVSQIMLKMLMDHVPRPDEETSDSVN